MHISSLSPLPKIRQPSTLLTCPPNLTGHQRHYLLLLPDWSVDDTHFFYYYQTCHWDDIHNDKEEQDYAIFSTSQKKFPDIFWTNTNKMQANSLTIFMIRQTIRDCQSDEAKKHPPDTMLSNKSQKTKTSESLILRKRRQANLQKNQHEYSDVQQLKTPKETCSKLTQHSITQLSITKIFNTTGIMIAI